MVETDAKVEIQPEEGTKDVAQDSSEQVTEVEAVSKLEPDTEPAATEEQGAGLVGEASESIMEATEGQSSV